MFIFRASVSQCNIGSTHLEQVLDILQTDGTLRLCKDDEAPFNFTIFLSRLWIPPHSRPTLHSKVSGAPYQFISMPTTARWA
ncbi:hypothetical protein VTP01DRAFT_9325, partial [Rhizomucor pusillus]|uniref:uncharacterized protein n=1 Tax=Rhizomucor pusillus TaxID=4840 RepID=UPI003742F3B0